MKIRNAEPSTDKIELQMTPMIDIVFQLLIFFIMTFKIVSQEGDFNIKMPMNAAPGNPSPDLEVPPMTVRLRADATGALAGISLNETGFGRMEELHNQIISIVGSERGPGSVQETAEVELDCDFNLHYEHVIAAITAVSGYIDQDGNIVKLIEKIKFKPQSGPTPGE